jgi:hypothetical protein
MGRSLNRSTSRHQVSHLSASWHCDVKWEGQAKMVGDGSNGGQWQCWRTRALKDESFKQGHNTWVWDSDFYHCPQPKNDFLNFWLPRKSENIFLGFTLFLATWQHVLYEWKMSFERRSFRWSVSTSVANNPQFCFDFRSVLTTQR